MNKKIPTFLVFSTMLLFAFLSASAQSNNAMQTTVGGQVFTYSEVKTKIQENVYDLNGDGHINTADKYILANFFNDLKINLNQAAGEEGLVSLSIFDLNDDGEINAADVKICRYFDAKLKKGFGLKIVGLAEAKTAILASTVDVNGDGMVNAYDRNIVKDFANYVKMASGVASSSERWRGECDLNGDEVVNNTDNEIIIAFYLLIKENYGNITTLMSVVKTQIVAGNPDLNNDSVVNLTDRYIYRNVTKGVKNYNGMTVNSANWAENAVNYDFNSDGIVNVLDARWLKNFYKIFKMQYSYAKASMGILVYDTTAIKNDILAPSKTFDLNGDGANDGIDALIYTAYYAEMKTVYRQVATTSAEHSVWEYVNFDLNDDDVIDAQDKKILSNYYKLLRADAKIEATRFKIK